MKKIYVILYSQLLLFSNLFAQGENFLGKVIDSNNGKELQGAVIKMGTASAITNKNGNFTINTEEKADLMVSFIGYNKVSITKPISNKFLVIKMQPSYNELKEVVISSNVSSIIRKAIARIGQNYPSFPTYAYYWQESLEEVNLIGYSLNDEALVKRYTPSYENSENACQVQVVQNKRKETIVDSTKKKTRWKGVYTIAQEFDFVYKRSLLANEKEIDNYSFSLNGIEPVDGRDAYSIEFSPKQDQKGILGFLYIDTATYAFLNITYSFGQKLKEARIKEDGLKGFSSLIQCSYKEQNGLYYLSKIHGEESKSFKKRNDTAVITTTLSLICIDSSNVKPLARSERVKITDKTIDISRPAVEQKWHYIDNLRKQTSFFTVIPDSISNPQLYRNKD